MKKIHNLKSISLALGLILTLCVAPVQVVAQNTVSAKAQQSYTVKGHVIDEEGETLPGVSIKRNGQVVGVTDGFERKIGAARHAHKRAFKQSQRWV